MDELSNIRIFHRVVAAGSFSQAARQLGLLPSSISRRIGTLEERLNVKLLNRTTRSMALTEAGEVYYAHIDRILEDLQQADKIVSDFQSMPQGTLCIETRGGLGTLLLAPLIPEFLLEHPGLKIKLHLTDYTNDTLGEGVDVAIRFGLGRSSSLTCRKLTSTRRVIFASPAYLAEHGAPRTPEDLTRHNCLGFSNGAGRVTVWRFLTRDGMYVHTIRGNFEANDISALLTVVTRGLGISVLHEWMVQDRLDDGRLVRLMPDTTVTTLDDFETPIYMIYASGQRQPAKIRAFGNFLAKRLRHFNPDSGAGKVASPAPLA